VKQPLADAARCDAPKRSAMCRAEISVFFGSEIVQATVAASYRRKISTGCG
jgi:hypothetical protein